MNTGNAFFHPVTHQLIQSNAFYEGAAHLEHEEKGEPKIGIEIQVELAVDAEAKDETELAVDAEAKPKKTGK